MEILEGRGLIARNGGIITSGNWFGTAITKAIDFDLYFRRDNYLILIAFR